MSTYQDVLNQVALIVGGTQPDPTHNPWWFSGATVGDGTGIAGLAGCYAVPPEVVETVPVGIILAHEFQTHYYPSLQQDEDTVRLMLLVRRNDSRTQVANLNPFRDSVPAAFATHMGLNASANVWQALVHSGRTGVFRWGDHPYLGWEFEIRIYRSHSAAFAL